MDLMQLVYTISFFSVVIAFAYAVYLHFWVKRQPAANKRIIEAAAKRIGAEISRFPMNLQEYGNTSSASIPILLHEMNRNGKLKKGQKLVLAGFGAGLSWGASVLEWGI